MDISIKVLEYFLEKLLCLEMPQAHELFVVVPHHYEKDLKTIKNMCLTK